MGVWKPNAGAEADRSRWWLEVDSGVLEGTGRNRTKGCPGGLGGKAWLEMALGVRRQSA